MAGCINHPHKKAKAHGLCMACYQRQRRAEAATYVGRAPVGANYAMALLHAAEWRSRYEAAVDRSGGPHACHEWQMQKTSGGYGVFYVAGKTLLAHRLAYELAVGVLGSDMALHRCDNPACVNPRHLFKGTASDNVADMHAKGRARSGPADHLRQRETHPRARPVETPLGQFPSATLAAEAAGLHPRTVARYCADGVKGYRYLA